MAGQTITPVILCGGAGTRLYPISTPAQPKQFLPFTADGKSLFHLAVERALAIGANTIALVTTENLLPLLERQLTPYKGCAAFHIIAEPCGRNTAAAIALAIQEVTESGFFWIKPSDHVIEQPDILYKAVRNAARMGTHEELFLFGIPPQGPCPDYGYIRTSGAERTALPVTDFIEKPPLDVAENIYQDGRHFWNSGMIAASRQALTRAFFCHASAYIQPDLRHDYAHLPAISFDKAVLEKTSDCLMLPCPCGWQDVGSTDIFSKVRQHKQIQAR